MNNFSMTTQDTDAISISKDKNLERNLLWEHLLGDSGMDCVPTYEQREHMKQFYWKTLQAYEKGKANLAELTDAAEDRLLAWFFRSAERIPLIHPRFPVYAAMLLNEDHIRRSFPDEVVEWLIAKYGQRRGIIEGSYWKC